MPSAAGHEPATSRELLEALGPAVIATDPAGIVQHWNPAAERMFGWRADEAIGASLDGLTAPQTGADVNAEISAALAQGTAWSGGVVVRRRDGSLFPALLTDSGVYRDGDLVALVGVYAYLGTALQPFLGRGTDPALVLRADAVVTFAGPSVQEFLGWRDGPLVGRSIVPFIHPRDRRGMSDYLHEVATEPGARDALEVRVLRDRSWVWVEAGLTNLLDDPVVHGVACHLRRCRSRADKESAEQRVAELEEALRSRLIVEQAKGMLAERLQVTPDQAFGTLRSLTQAHRLEIHDVARLVLSGDPSVHGAGQAPAVPANGQSGGFPN